MAYCIKIGNVQIGNAQIGNVEIGNAQIGNIKLGNAEIGRMEWPFSATVVRCPNLKSSLYCSRLQRFPTLLQTREEIEFKESVWILSLELFCSIIEVSFST